MPAVRTGENPSLVIFDAVTEIYSVLPPGIPDGGKGMALKETAILGAVAKGLSNFTATHWPSEVPPAIPPGQSQLQFPIWTTVLMSSGSAQAVTALNVNAAKRT
jgi:hypothetical protein